MQEFSTHRDREPLNYRPVTPAMSHDSSQSHSHPNDHHIDNTNHSVNYYTNNNGGGGDSLMRRLSRTGDETAQQDVWETKNNKK